MANEMSPTEEAERIDYLVEQALDRQLRTALERALPRAVQHAKETSLTESGGNPHSHIPARGDGVASELSTLFILADHRRHA